MATGFDALAAAGIQNKQADRQYAHQDQEEQRKAVEGALAKRYEGGEITGGDYLRGINDIYAHEPQESRFSRLKQAASKLIGRGQQQPQAQPARVSQTQVPATPAATTQGMNGAPMTTPALPGYSQPNLAPPAPGQVSPRQDLQTIMSGGKTTQQVAQEQQTSQQQGKQAATEQMMNWYAGLTPQQQKIAGPMIGIKDSAPYKVYVSADGKDRQAFRVGEQPEGYEIAPTGAAANAPEAKPLEAGGVPYGVQVGGKTYFANQMNDPNTPADAKQVWQTIQQGVKSKQDEQDKKQREADERQIRGLNAVAGRMAQSEQFQEGMAGFRADLNTYRALDKQARDSGALVDMYQQELQQPGNKSAFDTALITDYTGVLAKGGRKTQAEIQFAQKVGGYGLRADRLFQQAQNGELPPEMRKLYIDYMKARAQSDRSEADAAKPDAPGVTGGKAPAPKKGKGGSLSDRLNEALGK